MLSGAFFPGVAPFSRWNGIFASWKRMAGVCAAAWSRRKADTMVESARAVRRRAAERVFIKTLSAYRKRTGWPSGHPVLVLLVPRWLEVILERELQGALA